MKQTLSRATGWRPVATALLLTLAVLPLAAPAWAANVVNVTIKLPAVVYDNPCVAEPVSLHGTIHILLSVSSDRSGGYHVVNTWNASYSGTGLVSGATYTASESKQESWTTSRLPATHTTTTVTKLISKGGAQNAFLHTTLTTTIDANRVPTETVDSQSVACKG